MSAQSQFDREMDDIDEREAAGLLTRAQANTERRELERDYRGAAEEAAEDAYRNEMGNW